MAKPSKSNAKLAGLFDELEFVRSAIYVTASALDAGESDLELLSAKTLKHVFKMVDAISEDILHLRRAMPISDKEAANA